MVHYKSLICLLKLSINQERGKWTKHIHNSFFMKKASVIWKFGYFWEIL